MKKVLLFLCVIAITAISCKKEGPQGPAGPAGGNGTNGTNGVTGPTGPNGLNASVNCQQCHNQTTLLAAVAQYEESVHGEGEASFETRTSCAGCHTNEGFNECVATGKDDAAAEIKNATGVGCYTCHNIHKNYDATDLSLKVTAPITLRADPTTTLMDFGKGNLCAKCHQPRVLSVVDNKNVAVNLKTAADADSVYIKSSRFGPHHGPQSTLLAGKGYGAYEIGTISYSNGRHTDITNACITCHMAPSSSGKFIGGHSMKVIGEVEGNQTLNVNGCGATGCHAGKTASDMTTKINATQTRIQTLIDQAKALVIAKGWMYDVPSTDDNYELWKIPTTGSKAIKLNAKQAKACYNIKFIMEDRSQGIHNPDFAEALLKNSIETLQ